MDTKVKNYLGYAGVVVVLVFAYAALSFASTYSKSIEPSSFRSFTVSGDGKAVAIPDVGEFTYSIILEGGKDIVVLKKDADGKNNKIIEFLKDQGVEKKDIKVVNYNVEPRYQYTKCYRGGPIPLMESSGGGTSGVAMPSSAVAPDYISPEICPPSQIVGYTVRITTSVKTKDFEKIGTLLNGVVQNGANEVSQLYFSIDDRTEKENEARAEAIAKAKDKAESIAKAGGFRLGRLLNISEGYYPVYYRGAALEKGFGGADAAAPPVPTIEPGSQDINITVTLTYEIR